MLSFLRKDRRRAPIEQLHAQIAAASRAEGLYTRLGVPDTLEGRFESLGLHLILVLRRLRVLPPPGGDIAQELVDCFFRLLDANLRELGVGDTVVPKRMKKLAAAFQALGVRYDPVISAERRPDLIRTLADGFAIPDEPATALADYVLAAERELAGLDLESIAGGRLPWPRPEAFGGEQ